MRLPGHALLIGMNPGSPQPAPQRVREVCFSSQDAPGAIRGTEPAIFSPVNGVTANDYPIFCADLPLI
jgi:hypothetical protein